jgi:hypothetical protein
VNALWGLANFFIGYTLIFKVGDFHFGMTRDVLMVGLGALAAAVFLSSYFGRVRGKR